ncbi:unnamed protein product [Ambrosiozyma monospora]|uniref:Unnamed protein product n=1 Tax=Ambrosiozyma monospora TaxID=43982 RepID=A0ACB5TVN4_AMBMO|nr:unnamed protein product [Ambrosiozyma monospora]
MKSKLKKSSTSMMKMRKFPVTEKLLTIFDDDVPFELSSIISHQLSDHIPLLTAIQYHSSTYTPDNLPKLCHSNSFILPDPTTKPQQTPSSFQYFFHFYNHSFILVPHSKVFILTHYQLPTTIMFLPLTILHELSKRDSSDDCKGKNSDSQMCQTGTTTSTTTIVLAVVLPVCALGLGLGFMIWKGYKRNKEEALEDDDPEFTGETAVMPDYPAASVDDFKGAGPYYNPSANNSGVNPFKGANEK